MERSSDDLAQCAICRRVSDEIWACSICEKDVCKADCFWCSEISCDRTVCKLCQDSCSPFQIKRVCAMNYFCVRHLRDVCFFCASPYALFVCSECPRRMCSRHLFVCSTPRCLHTLCRSCEEVPDLAMLHHTTGDVCRRCADPRRSNRPEEWLPISPLSHPWSPESETSFTASLTANANVAADIDELESSQSFRFSFE
jgi:hypothetical protein